MDKQPERLPDPPERSEFAAPTWQPHEYQVRGISWLLRGATLDEKFLGSALFFPPGLGKTSVSLAAIEALRAQGLPYRTLVLAPLKVAQTTWLGEYMKWGQFQHFKIGLAHGPDKQLVLEDPYYDIVVMNYDGLAWAAPVLAKGHKFTVLLCDELTRLKNPSTKRYKFLKNLLPTFLFRWGLTGTPVANGLLDLFGQVYVLDLGRRFGRYVTHYRAKYFHQEPWDRYGYHISEEKSEELIDKVKDLAMFVEPAEWLQLPDFLSVIRPIELPKEVKSKYDFLEDEFILKLNEGVVTAANAGVLTSKLRQFTGGAIYTQPGVWDTVDDTKLEELEDLIEECAGMPLMVAYNFDHERERILEKFPKALVLKGGMNERQTRYVVDTWNTGVEPLLLVQPASASMGLNLQFGGHAICWFSLTYNLEEFIQLNKRLHRQGQVNTVLCYVLTAKGTIDEHVAKVLLRKDTTQQDLLNALKMIR